MIKIEVGRIFVAGFFRAWSRPTTRAGRQPESSICAKRTVKRFPFVYPEGIQMKLKSTATDSANSVVPLTLSALVEFWAEARSCRGGIESFDRPA